MFVLVQVLVVLLIASCCTSFAPTWAAIVAWSMTGVVLLFFCGIYTYFAITRPELLHTEKYLVTPDE